MKRLLYALALLLVLATFACAQDTVSVRSGKVSGTRTSDGVIRVFRGIPYAAPPIAGLRWKAPQPVVPWDGVRACTAFGPSPMQGKPTPFSMWSKEFLIPDEPIGEDCLYLNVWTVAKAATDKLPVLVWIYGGGFSSGGSGVPIYDGEAMARMGIVFVSINYRVGIYGFFAHPELTKESGRNASGNYGLMDQLAALRWVNENIAAFGGDPGQVTTAGQSAGSISVNYLVASPLAKGLFQRAIAESGATFSRSRTSLEQAEKAGLELSKSLNAASLADLRSKPAEELMKARGMRGPIVDGYVLPRHVADVFAAGKQNPVDLLTGWNEDEGLMFGPTKNAEEYKRQINEQYGDKAEAFLSFFPAADDAEAAHSQLHVSRDAIFGIQNYTWANAQAAQGKGSVYVYRFMRKVPGTGQYAKYGAFHTGEVPYAYDNLRFVERPWETADRELAATMSHYWANFIKRGDPNGESLPKWPAYELKDRQVMLLDTRVEARPIPDRAALDFMCSALNTPVPRKAPAPLFRDPIHDGAADATLVWNRAEKCWWMLYTNRRADADDEKSVKWCHGTDIGIASTPDGGATWTYRGIAGGLEFETNGTRNTFWAPEVVDFGGKYHGFISYVRGVPETWKGTRDILHYTSTNLIDWHFESIVVPGCIDACVHRLPDGRWRMWFKNEQQKVQGTVLDSDDLYTWRPTQSEMPDPDPGKGEGPEVFFWKGWFWMVKDIWRGLGVYRSADLESWKYMGVILDQPGNRPGDHRIGQHPGALIQDEDRAYLVYFVHQAEKEPAYRHTWLQVGKLGFDGNTLTCDRDEEFDFNLKEPAPEFTQEHVPSLTKK